MTNGVHEANNKTNGSANKEIQESNDSAKSEQQDSSHKRELALDLRYYMNRAPVTVSLDVRSGCLGKELQASNPKFI